MTDSQENKLIQTVCMECGRKYDRKHKSSFGVWIDDCDMCGAEGVACADAQHDFGIYNNEQERKTDRVQNLI